MTSSLFSQDAVSLKGDERLLKIKNTVARLPPPHYRTAKFLFAHLNRMSLYSAKTGMDSRNLAIVWSPNLMRFVYHIYVFDENDNYYCGLSFLKDKQVFSWDCCSMLRLNAAVQGLFYRCSNSKAFFESLAF